MVRDPHTRLSFHSEGPMEMTEQFRQYLIAKREGAELTRICNWVLVRPRGGEPWWLWDPTHEAISTNSQKSTGKKLDELQRTL